MTCDHLVRVLALYAALCAVRADSTVQGARDFEKKVSILLREEPESPKCFVEGKNDFTCLWEEDEERAGHVAQYSFTYRYQHENSSRCPLRAVPAPGGKTLFICHLNQTQMFVRMDIRVRRERALIHNRSLLIDLVFLLDPPGNVTASGTGKQGQLNVSWVPPPLKHMDDSMMYEIRYAEADGHAWKVEVAWASSELILRGLQPGTRYKVQVRVKLDGISYDGFWSFWSDPVFVQTLPAEFNPLILSLTLVISFILMVLWLTTVLSHRRFLTKKIWPTIPTPESKFQGLFTVHGGNFQEWLGQTNGGLWLTPAFLYPEERPSPLEVLSELSLCPALTSPPLPPKVSRAPPPEGKEERRSLTGPGEGGVSERGGASGTPGRRSVPHDLWLMERLRAHHQHPVPCSQSSLLESQDTYVTLSNHHQGRHRPDDHLEETSPLGVLFASRKTPLSHSDLGSVQQSSGSGLSSQSSFEDPNHAWIPKGLGYAYMAVADSGVSMDYSPMSRADVDVGKDVVIYANQ